MTVRGVSRASIGLFALLFIAGGAAPASAWDVNWRSEFAGPVNVGGSAIDSTGAYLGGLIVGEALPGQTLAGGSDVFLRKHDSGDGAPLWTRQFGTSTEDVQGNVAADPSGVYVGGWTFGSFPEQSSAGLLDAFVRKYDPAGGVVWTAQFGTSGSDRPFWGGGLAVHTSGVYVGGYTRGTFPGQPGGGPAADIFLARLDPATGQVTWVRQFGTRGLILNEAFGGVAADDTGVYVAVRTQSTEPGATQIGRLRKFDFSGNVLWSRDRATVGTCRMLFNDVATYATDVYVTGYSSDETFEQDPSACTTTKSSPTVGALVKYDSDGQLQWQRRFKGEDRGSAANFTGAKYVSASESGVFVSGNLTSRFPGTVQREPWSDRSECDVSDPLFFDRLDAFVRLYDFAGRVVWTHQFGTHLFDIANAGAADASGAYVAALSSCELDPADSTPGRPDGADDYASLTHMLAYPTSASGKAQLIVGKLETLSDAQRLGTSDLAALMTKVETALGALDQNQRNAARRALEAFIESVDRMQSRGALTQEEASELVSAANAVIAEL